MVETGRSTGWFGRPNKKGGKVHVVENGRPICGVKIPTDSEFQFCGAGVHYHMVECERCFAVLTPTVKPTPDKPDIRLIIRPNRRIKVSGENVVYHIRAIVDAEQVVVRHWSKQRWHYTIKSMTWFELMYKDGRLS